MTFVNRRDAGRRLAKELSRFHGKDTVVLALPRGGVVLGVEVARKLKAPLGIILVRKIGHPIHPEYAIGAVVEDEDPIYRKSDLEDIDKNWRQKAEVSARRLLSRRRKLYLDDDMPPPTVEGRTAIIVDDGIATGLTMRASIRAIKNKYASKIVIAVPVAPADSIASLKGLADEVIVLDDPANFLGAVGAHYQKFDQVNDEEVRQLLKEANHELYQAVA